MNGTPRWLWLGIAATSVAILAAATIPYVLWLELSFPTFLAGMTFAVVGVLLVARRPENSIGYLLVVMGAVWALGEGAYTYLASVAVGELPPSELISWLNGWAFYPMLVLLVWVIGLFPSGRVASRWMRWPLRLAIGVGVIDVSARMVVPISPEQSPLGEEFVDNPWAWDVLNPLGPLVQGLDYVMVGLLILAVVDLVVRWRTSHGMERRQMQWLVLGLVVFAGMLLAALAVERANIDGIPNDLAWDLAWFAGLGSVPVSIGVAVARYRLYEIDRLVSRTVSYGVVAGLLAGVYAAIAIGLPQLLPVTLDSLLVAVATLAIVGLFSPMRARVQRVVDRRFNRVRYDTAREMDRFAERLRSELDLDGIEGEIMDLVGSTMQPTAAGVWLREDRR